MLSDIEIQISDWNKSKFEETDSLPLMTTPGPVVLILVTYLLFIFKIGPSYMKNKEPYKLTTVLILYNTFQIVFSAYLVKKYFKRLFRQGLVPKSCLINDESHRNEILFGMWLYFAAKASELLDTVFFVMRKKFNQITILHVYHHSVMVVGSWAYCKYWPSETLFFIGFINSLVHVFMYTYYGLAALGPNLEKYIFWKKYMTKFQLVQLISIVVHYIVAVRRSECPPASGVATFIASNVVVILILFLHFYWQSYTKRGKIPSIRVCHHIEKED